MDEEKLKQAFAKIKEDITNLNNYISETRREIQRNNELIKQMDDELVQIKLNLMAQNQEFLEKNVPTHSSTHPEKTSTYPTTPTHSSTHPQEIGGWKTQNLSTSTGNEGVSTDRQTDRQTDQQTHFQRGIPLLGTTNLPLTAQNLQYVVTNKKSLTQAKKETDIRQKISEASEILDSLDNIKKDIRRKFKSITKQEMLVFTTLFIMEEAEDPDYSKLASKLHLSESSIRDYVQRMISKGIPIEKEKLNNKKIILHISPELKKIVSLDTIIRLREL